MQSNTDQDFQVIQTTRHYFVLYGCCEILADNHENNHFYFDTLIT